MESNQDFLSTNKRTTVKLFGILFRLFFRIKHVVVVQNMASTCLSSALAYLLGLWVHCHETLRAKTQTFPRGIKVCLMHVSCLQNSPARKNYIGHLIVYSISDRTETRLFFVGISHESYQNQAKGCISRKQESNFLCPNLC